MNLEISDVNAATAKLTLQGRLDTAGVDAIETHFTAAAVSSGKHVLVDLSQVLVLTSMGIRMLIGTARAMHNRKIRMIIFGAQAIVSETLEHVSLHEVIPVVSTEDQALALLAR